MRPIGWSHISSMSSVFLSCLSCLRIGLYGPVHLCSDNFLPLFGFGNLPIALYISNDLPNGPNLPLYCHQSDPASRPPPPPCSPRLPPPCLPPLIAVIKCQVLMWQLHERCSRNCISLKMCTASQQNYAHFPTYQSVVMFPNGWMNGKIINMPEICQTLRRW